MKSHFHFCHSGELFNPVWFNYGFSPCFYDTFTPIVTLIVVTAITIVLISKHKSSTGSSDLNTFSKSQTWLVEVLLVAIVIEVVNYLVSGTQIPGSLILSSCLDFVSYTTIIILLRHSGSRAKTLFTSSLVLFWTWTLIRETGSLLLVKRSYWRFSHQSVENSIELSVFITRLLLTIVALCISVRLHNRENQGEGDHFKSSYETIDGSTGDDGDDDPEVGRRSGVHPQELNVTVHSLRSLIVQVKGILPYIWPKGHLLLQLNVFFCLVLLVAGRVANLFVPIYNGYIVNSLGESSDDWDADHESNNDGSKFRWELILVWLGLKALQGGIAGTSGILTNITTFLWLYVQQYTAKKVETEFFAHLHSLSLRWHYQRKTGAVLRSMNRGTDSINNILQYLLFNVIPAAIDILIAIIFFAVSFNGMFALIVALTLILYLVVSICTTKWRTKYNRTMNAADNLKNEKGVDGLLNFETVKNYGNEEFEQEMYTAYMDMFQTEEVKFTATMTAIDMAQTLIINCGFLAGILLCARMVVSHQGLDVGDYVLFSTYLTQLFEPLSNMGVYYKIVLRRIVDMENMFQIFKEVPEITDPPGAPDLVVTQGRIEFRDVSFGYIPDRKVINNVSFVVEPGQTVALVGPSGGGKTSIVRLLLHYFNTESGQILIDGQDITKVTQKSLRKAVGVVPQETVLFNDTIKYNIKYGHVRASDDEVVEAAKIAWIHDRIISFPKKYDAAVGERGMKLSGGEKQRVSIARTILKNPAIILLDEATSSLDTETERQIQGSLQDLCKNRTCLIVAHRLSTIVNADVIHVLKHGVIRESGTHAELMRLRGIYARMWETQLLANGDDSSDDPNSNGDD